MYYLDYDIIPCFHYGFLFDFFFPDISQVVLALFMRFEAQIQ